MSVPILREVRLRGLNILPGFKQPHEASQVAQRVKNPPGMQETQVQSLDWEDPLEEGMATQSSNFAGESHRGAWRAAVDGVTKSLI